MKARFTGGKSHGKEVEIKDAWSFLNVTDPPPDWPTETDIITREVYELVSVSAGVALYRFQIPQPK